MQVPVAILEALSLLCQGQACSLRVDTNGRGEWTVETRMVQKHLLNRGSRTTEIVTSHRLRDPDMLIEIDADILTK